MNRSTDCFAISLACCLLLVALGASSAADMAPENSTRLPRELSGALSGPPNRTATAQASGDTKGFDETGAPQLTSPLAALPVIDAALAARMQDKAHSGPVRLIIHLGYQPHAAEFKRVTNKHAEALKDLEFTRQALLAETAKNRDASAKTDAQNYASMIEFEKSYLADLHAMNQRHESLSLAIATEATRQIKSMVSDYQAPIIEQIESIGGKVEQALTAGNILVVSVAADRIKAIADIPGVMRVIEDSVLTGHLNVLPAATLVEPPDTTLLGLWDAGNTGGIYDPAIIDTGIDDQHPGLADSVTPSRENFYSWYLSAGFGSSSWDDEISNDDLQGHGTSVAGIVASYGTASNPDNLGLAYGVGKLVNLKAGWRTTSGSASMFWSDKYQLVDRALYASAQLVPFNTFNDDVDGMNLSFGGATTLDDTDGSRFWDSVISTYPDLPVTISAGDSGPNNTLFSDPALAYNVIAVANANDRGTSSRSDDLVNSGSTLGPTASGRRKPDIAAYGTSISTTNYNWETSADYVSQTGTSMAAPAVLGIIMDLADAAVFDEVTVKALLLNTAQKNLPGIDIESDADGWDPQVGWGVVNAYAAYYHRFDTFQDSVTPRNTDGEYQLYKGSMRDEGDSGEGRDRATLVWNRTATYNTAAPPTDFYSLNDLNLRLYAEATQQLFDIDASGLDNVHQVRVPAGTADTDVIVKVYSWSTSFADGTSSQAYALATEDGFTRVDLPTGFQGIALWPTEVEPNEEFTIEFWLRNDSTIASHDNVFDLNLPAGFTLVSGVDTQNIGSISGEGGNSNRAFYTVRAPAAVADGLSIIVDHSHNSYLEEYGPFAWNMVINVRVDNTPPNPNPMTFSSAPSNIAANELSMRASSAFDIHNPIQYFHDYTSSPSGGAGATDSGWVESRNHEDSGLESNHEYCYRVWARDNANFPNLTTASDIACAYTDQDAPGAVDATEITTTSFVLTLAAAPDNLALGSSGIRFETTDATVMSPWQQDASAWTAVGQSPATSYQVAARARNGDGDETVLGASLSVTTLANPPAVDAVSAVSHHQIRVQLDTNGNGPAAEYMIENTTTGDDSGWLATTEWLNEGLACEMPYNYQAKARNSDGIETITISVGVANSGMCLADELFSNGFEVGP